MDDGVSSAEIVIAASSAIAAGMSALAAIGLWRLGSKSRKEARHLKINSRLISKLEDLVSSYADFYALCKKEWGETRNHELRKNIDTINTLRNVISALDKTTGARIEQWWIGKNSDNKRLFFVVSTIKARTPKLSDEDLRFLLRKTEELNSTYRDVVSNRNQRKRIRGWVRGKPDIVP